MDEIENAIDNAKVFVPIISSNIAREAMEAHAYRKEWKIGLGIQEIMGNRDFIIPIHEEGFDFYNADIPKQLKRHNSLPYNKEYNFRKVLDSINEALNKLDNFKTYNTIL